jgi:hypothetical protein
MDTDKYMKITVEMRETAKKSGKMSVCVELSDWIGEMLEIVGRGNDPEWSGRRSAIVSTSQNHAVGYLTALGDMLHKIDGIIEKNK